jgi:hypothetical protein
MFLSLSFWVWVVSLTTYEKANHDSMPVSIIYVFYKVCFFGYVIWLNWSTSANVLKYTYFCNLLVQLKQRQPISVIFSTMNAERSQRAPASGSMVYNFSIIKIYIKTNATPGYIVSGLVAMDINMINNS